jgi:hypothetical protein
MPSETLVGYSMLEIPQKMPNPGSCRPMDVYKFGTTALGSLPYVEQTLGGALVDLDGRHDFSPWVMYLIHGSVHRNACFAWRMDMMLLLAFLGCKEVEEADGLWEVTITGGDVDDDGNATTCTSDVTGYQETMRYSLFYTGSFVELKIGEDLYATGQQRGCFLEYQSSLYLEEGEGAAGDFRWKIEGRADVQGAAGGCTSIPEDYDWYGTEILTVVASENDDIEEDCYYEMSVEGVYVIE